MDARQTHASYSHPQASTTRPWAWPHPTCALSAHPPGCQDAVPRRPHGSDGPAWTVHPRGIQFRKATPPRRPPGRAPFLSQLDSSAHLPVVTLEASMGGQVLLAQGAQAQAGWGPSLGTGAKASADHRLRDPSSGHTRQEGGAVWEKALASRTTGCISPEPSNSAPGHRPSRTRTTHGSTHHSG